MSPPEKILVSDPLPKQVEVVNRNLERLSREFTPYAISRSYTLSVDDSIDSLQVDATSGNITITLPPPTGNRRRRIVKTDASANTVTVTAGGNLINGVASHILSVRYGNITVEPTGTSWLIVGWNTQVIINGGSINNTPVGATTPNTGAFTTLSSTGATVLATASGDVGVGTASAFTNTKFGVLGEVWFGDSATRSASGSGGITLRRAGADSVRYITMICEGSVTGKIESGGAGDRISTKFTNDASGNYYFETGGTTRLTISTLGVIVNGIVRLKNYTVAALPAGTQGDIAYVTDALAPTFLAAVVGGGTVVTPVFYNGTTWVAF